ncbi:Hypp7987 [Branchiostoma lanceolatum]|uniref:Hypp7987 protein n=1 Tax=Branchiostoma lanceolatum TaxID=7740 RepID=A0A8J9Z5Q9_BRALA|nr:Hypp7987 [Branchiostoma lanceolatum]
MSTTLAAANITTLAAFSTPKRSSLGPTTKEPSTTAKTTTRSETTRRSSNNIDGIVRSTRPNAFNFTASRSANLFNNVQSCDPHDHRFNFANNKPLCTNNGRATVVTTYVNTDDGEVCSIKPSDNITVYNDKYNININSQNHKTINYNSNNHGCIDFKPNYNDFKANNNNNVVDDNQTYNNQANNYYTDYRS